MTSIDTKTAIYSSAAGKPVISAPSDIPSATYRGLPFLDISANPPDTVLCRGTLEPLALFVATEGVVACRAGTVTGTGVSGAGTIAVDKGCKCVCLAVGEGAMFWNVRRCKCTPSILRNAVSRNPDKQVHWRSL